MIKLVNKDYINRRAKRIEKHNLREYKSSLTWCSMLHDLYKCVITFHENAIEIDTVKLEEITKKLKGKSNVFN